LDERVEQVACADGSMQQCPNNSSGCSRAITDGATLRIDLLFSSVHVTQHDGAGHLLFQER